MRHAILSAALLTSLGGCALAPDNYFGNYDVSCPGLSPATGWRDAAQVPERIAARLARPLTELRPDFSGTVRHADIASPPDPHIYIQLQGDYEIFILVTAADPKEDAATRAANQAIAEVLKASSCNQWQFRITHHSKMFAALGAGVGDRT